MRFGVQLAAPESQVREWHLHRLSYEIHPVRQTDGAGRKNSRPGKTVRRNLANELKNQPHDPPPNESSAPL